MKTTFQFKVENISTEDVKLNGVDVLVSGEINAEELESVGGLYGKLVEAIASIGMMVQKLDNGEPLVQQNSNSNESEEVPSDGAPLTKSAKEACKKAVKKAIKGEKKRGRKAAKKLEELLKKDDVEDAQAAAGWDTL